MKTIGKVLFDIIVGVWLVCAIFVTICLLSYNEFKVTTFGKTSLLIIDSDELEPNFLEGDLLIIKRGSDNKINVGDNVFYYNSAMNSNVLVYNGNVQGKEAISKDETTFTINNQSVSGEYVIGKTNGSKVMHKAGTILKVFTSKWGFMFLVIFPTLFAIIYEIMMVIEASRGLKNNEPVKE